MRILHVVESLDRGGLERVVCDLALEQRRLGVRVRVFCLFHAGPLAETLRSSGVEVVLGDKRPGFDWRAARRLREAALAERADVVHSHNPVANYYSCAALPLWWRDPPIVNTRHNMGAARASDQRERIFRWSLMRTARGVMVSKTVADRFVGEGIIPAAKVRVQRNAIPACRYPVCTPETRAAARRRLGIDEDEFVVGAVGRLAQVKNHALLIDAVAALAQVQKSVRLVIVGEGELRQSLVERARSRGVSAALFLTGERPDVDAILPGFDVYAMPSLSEGHSIALLEASMVGLPIVATAVGGNPEIVEDGVTGLLVPSGNVAAMAGALRRLAGDRELRRSMGVRAREWSLKNVSVEAMAGGYQRIYADVMSAR